uniref:Fetuin B n=1 Tax=Sciurus vulgaris TaxID=55149 RepID=A0A8D2B7D3_SCIVU
MGLLRLLVLCILATCCRTGSPPQEVLKPSPLLPRGCNDSDVLAVAGFALQDINKEQKDGYVLALNRVHSVWEHRQAYGQCKAMFYINQPRRVLYLPAYNCTLRPVSRRKLNDMCPDCPNPILTDWSDPSILEAARESLAKYNNESTSKQYSLVKVTRASSQWVFDPTYFVEYLVKESPCTKSQASNCSFQSSDSVPIGLCKGSLTQGNSEKLVSVTCDFFTSQIQAPEGENSAVQQVPASLPKLEEHPKKNATSSKSSSQTAPTGSVQYLPDLDDEKPKDSQGEGPQEAFPVQLEFTTNPQGDTLDVSFLGLKEEKLVVLPFPPKNQHSDKCPGPAQNANPLILPP